MVFEQISDYLRLNETIPITQINTLAELPPTSPTEPKIVVVTQDIDEKLTRDFYGILITQHHFNLKNGAKMYGVLYTTQESDKSNRYVTYSREVVKYFDEHYSIWHFCRIQGICYMQNRLYTAETLLGVLIGITLFTLIWFTFSHWQQRQIAY